MPESMPFYNTKTPYTELGYTGTLLANRQKSEDNIHFLHTQNFTPTFQEKQGNTFVVAPVKPLGISRLEMDKAKLRRAYLEGYYVMEALWPNLKKYLEERR